MEMNQLAPHLKGEVKRFGTLWNLTPREQDVLSLIAHGTTRIKDVASTLNLSPNTINNHVNAIFTKTQTRSKSQLLTLLLSACARELTHKRSLFRSPRVLMLGASAECERIYAEFQKHGCRVELLKDAGRLKQMLSGSAVNFVVIDAGQSCVGIESVARTAFDLASPWANILFFGSSCTLSDRARWMNAGAIDFMVAPSTPYQVYTRMMAHYSDDSESLAHFEAQILSSPSAGQVSVNMEAGSIGRGGVFVPLDKLRLGLSRPAEVGDRVDLKINVDDGEVLIRGPGQIMWVREADNGPLPAGVGIRLVAVQAADREVLERFCGLNSIRSYIPSGVAAIESVAS